jgi:hypothetical protein
MNDSTTSTTGGGAEREPSEEEVRAALEAEMKRIKVDDIIVQTVVSLVNLGGRRAGLAPGTEDERDLDQVRTAIEAVRGLLPLLEGNPEISNELGPIRDALSQLQMAYAQLSGGGAPGPGTPSAGGKPPEKGDQDKGDDEGPGPAQSSGRLWVPGQ